MMMGGGVGIRRSVGGPRRGTQTADIRRSGGAALCAPGRAHLALSKHGRRAGGRGAGHRGGLGEPNEGIGRFQIVAGCWRGRYEDQRCPNIGPFTNDPSCPAPWCWWLEYGQSQLMSQYWLCSRSNGVLIQIGNISSQKEVA